MFLLFLFCFPHSSFSFFLFLPLRMCVRLPLSFFSLQDCPGIGLCPFMSAPSDPFVRRTSCLFSACESFPPVFQVFPGVFNAMTITSPRHYVFPLHPNHFFIRCLPYFPLVIAKDFWLLLGVDESFFSFASPLRFKVQDE